MQLCLHRSLLEKSGSRFSMKLCALRGVTWYKWIAGFLAGGHTCLSRYIAVHHKDDGSLASHVYVMNAPAVEFEIGFTLANLENEADSIHIGMPERQFANRSANGGLCL